MVIKTIILYNLYDLTAFIDGKVAVLENKKSINFSSGSTSIKTPEKKLSSNVSFHYALHMLIKPLNTHKITTKTSSMKHIVMNRNVNYIHFS